MAFEVTITYHEYWREIARSAESLFDSALLSEKSNALRYSVEDSKSKIDEAFYDHLVTYVDGHHWYTYTWANVKVLEHTENRNALFDEGFSLFGTESFEQIIQQFAYWSMYVDIAAYYADHIDGWIEKILEEEYASGMYDDEDFNQDLYVD